jgi:hypothetical protein
MTDGICGLEISICHGHVNKCHAQTIVPGGCKSRDSFMFRKRKLKLAAPLRVAVTMLELGSLELSIDSFQVASSLST